MDKVIRTFGNLDDLKAEEFRDWRALPAYQRMSAVSEITLALYGMKNVIPDVRRLHRTLIHLQRPEC